MIHSRTYYELMLERTNDPIKAEEARRGIAYWDRKEGKPAPRECRVTPREINPSPNSTWLAEWLERAAPWLRKHRDVSEGTNKAPHVRLLADAPIAELASETRLVFVRTVAGQDMHNVRFPSRALKMQAVRFIEERQG